MLGWNQRTFFPGVPFFLPRDVAVVGGTGKRWAVPCVCLALSFALAVALRLLEQPYWDNPAYRLGEEFLLATHDAYHWIAGAEGFEFGAGHPMSELARVLSGMLGMPPANLGFWLPPFMGGLLAVAVCAWGTAFGRPFAGLCAGVVSSLAPGFFARTLLGYYDTDLVVLLFAVLLGFGPALWISPWLISVPELLARGIRAWLPVKPESALAAVPGLFAPPPDAAKGTAWRFGPEGSPPSRFSFEGTSLRHSALSWPWLLLLMFSGLFGHSMQEWHSLFPYLVRFSAVALPSLILVLGPRGGRAVLLRGALCHAFPLLLGLPGLLAAFCYACPLAFPGRNGGEDKAFRPGVPAMLRRLAWRKSSLYVLWVVVLALCADAEVFRNMLASFSAYVYRSGDLASQSVVADDPIIFPSVSQSIIEVQTVSLQEVLLYCYPYLWVTAAAVAAFALLLPCLPALIWLVPLLALSFLSLKMGGRMTMFGAPALLLSLCMGSGWMLEIFGGWMRRYAAFFPGVMRRGGALARDGVCLAGTVCITLALAWPEVALIPDYTQGPIISREQAEALAFLKEDTPPESMIWNWWDWGYATQHFARRSTIADGARHGGPSLFLPAAVYTTADPRFARQLIKYTALKGNEPGAVFEGLSAAQAQQLMVDLGDKKAPLVAAPGRQYLVASFELMRLGVWVTRYGSWNFVRKKESGSLMNNITVGLGFNLDTGEVSPQNGKILPAASIDIFTPAGLVRNTYRREAPAYHFVFNPQSQEEAAMQATSRETPLARFWARQRGYFGFTAQVNDKMSMDDVYYNTLMVQLMLCNPEDPRIAPYFRLVFDNVYARVYEVL